MQGICYPRKELIMSKFKLSKASDLENFPDLRWVVEGVMPETGLAAIYGEAGCGKSFFCLDLSFAIATGEKWFGLKTNQSPVVFIALEGKSSLKERVTAWELENGLNPPSNWSFIHQDFKITSPEDVNSIAEIIPKGSVIFIDTLNLASPNIDENTSTGMGLVLTLAKELQSLTDGLIIFVHHTGKNQDAGLRGHTSLIAAMDSAIMIKKTGIERHWELVKNRDAIAGLNFTFKLKQICIGTNSQNETKSSCVIEIPQYPVRNLKVPQGENQKLIFDSLTALFTNGENGIEDAPANALCIRIEDAISAGAACLKCKPDKKTHNARIILERMINNGLLAANKRWIWKV